MRDKIQHKIPAILCSCVQSLLDIISSSRPAKYTPSAALGHLFDISIALRRRLSHAVFAVTPICYAGFLLLLTDGCCLLSAITATHAHKLTNFSPNTCTSSIQHSEPAPPIIIFRFRIAMEGAVGENSDVIEPQVVVEEVAACLSNENLTLS